MINDKEKYEALKAVAEDVYLTAKSKGWHDKPIDFPTCIALIHSELSEALEADRKQYGVEKVAEELADVVIRTFDLAEAMYIDIARAILAKNAKNKGRTWRHGGLPY